MANFSMRSKKYVPLTRAFADWYLALPKLDGERGISEDHALFLAMKMQDGLFLEERTQIATVWVRGKQYKLNGGHTCTARLAVDDTKPTWRDPRIMVCDYDCKTLVDASALYAQIDPAIASRNYAHLSRVKWANTGILENNSKRMLTQIASAMAFEAGGWTQAGQRNFKWDKRYDLPCKDRSTLASMIALMGNGERMKSKHLHREPVSCAILRTLRCCETDASAFWGKVRDGEMLSDSQPEKVLRDWLLSIYAKGGMGERGGRKASFHEIYSRCITAWNAYRTKRPVKAFKYYKDSPLPLAV